MNGLNHTRPPPSARFRLGLLCLGYILIMLYSSTVIGPAGPHFVFQDPAAAFHQFLGTRFVAHGSDQRADWIGNLLMLIPFGFLTTGTIWPRRPIFRLPAVIAAIAFCLITILAIKYLQLFFPPRTVTLNYILAQTLGASIGCAAFAFWHRRIGPSAIRPDQTITLVLVLRLYCLALLIFLLMPLDFALNTTDLLSQAARLPDTLRALPGEDRPLTVRAILLAAGSAAFIPVGMLLVFVKTDVYRIRRGMLAVTRRGLAITTGIFALSTLIMGASPFIASILYRTIGIMIGAAILRWLTRRNTDRLRHILRGLVPWLVLPYLVALMLVNRLLSLHWLSPHEAIAQAYPLGIIPLFDYYIVSKAAAAKNIVAHALLYMPVGVAQWLRDGTPRPVLAFIVAATLSFGMELARYFRPGLEGDINAVFVGGLSAALSAIMMPKVWSMIKKLARPSAPAVAAHRDPLKPAIKRNDLPPASAEIEEY